MGDRERDRDWDHRDRDRDRDRDRERDRRRDKESDRERDRDRDRDRGRDRDRDRERRNKRSRTPDHGRSHHRSRSRSEEDRSQGRHGLRHDHRGGGSSPDRKQRRRDSEDRDVKERQKPAVSEFVDVIVKEQHGKKDRKEKENGGDGMEVDGVGDNDEVELMKKLGIPVGFDTTKGKPVLGADVSGVRAVTKRQPRQYMNRRGGFNRPLPAERNR